MSAPDTSDAAVEALGALLGEVERHLDAYVRALTPSVAVRSANLLQRVRRVNEVTLRALLAERTTLTQQHAAEVAALRECLEWYGEQARLCRLIHAEGDAGRHALDADGGERARTALAAVQERRT